VVLREVCHRNRQRAVSAPNLGRADGGWRRLVGFAARLVRISTDLYARLGHWSSDVVLKHGVDLIQEAQREDRINCETTVTPRRSTHGRLASGTPRPRPIQLAHHLPPQAPPASNPPAQFDTRPAPLASSSRPLRAHPTACRRRRPRRARPRCRRRLPRLALRATEPTLSAPRLLRPHRWRELRGVGWGSGSTGPGAWEVGGGVVCRTGRVGRISSTRDPSGNGNQKAARLTLRGQ